MSSVTCDTTEHFFLWTNGVMRDLGPSLGGFASVADLNASGQVLIDAFTEPGCCPTQRMLLWDGNSLRDITVGANSLPADLNDRTQIAGTTGDDPGWGRGQVFRWDNTALTGPNGFGVAINSSGTIAAYLGNSVNRPHVAVWDGVATWELESAPESLADGSQPYAINDRGDVVGELDDRAVLWRRRDQSLASRLPIKLPPLLHRR
jgi:uncharacterized membrane protein